MRALALGLTVIAATAAACGDDLRLPPLQGDIAARLAALPGVDVQEIVPDAQNGLDPAFRYFDLHFDQLIDHDHPEAGTYSQRASLIHRSDDAPLVVVVGGYDIYSPRNVLEPTYLTSANQLSLEYRFYGTSHPAVTPWPHLDVRSWQLDQHAAVQDLERVYPSSHRIVTGWSKGGENALESMRMFPDDYDGAIAYVPPVITDLPDARYAHVLDDIGTADCRDRLRAVQRELLTRRAMVETRATADAQQLGDGFTHAGLGKAVETAIVELEFAYWMETLHGAQCQTIPDPTATDDALYTFLTAWSPPSGYGDASLARSNEQYTFQVLAQLGYPVWEHAHLDDLMQYSYEDFTPFLPVGVAQPAYDPTVARDLASWVANDADRIMIVGGEWDPWGAGYPASVPAGRDAHRFIVAQGSHWSTYITTLAPADLQQALDVLAWWSGTPANAMPTAAPPPPALRPGVRGGGVRFAP